MNKMDELLKYNSCTSIPKDFDEFWNESLCELKSINPDIEMNKVMDLPTVECYELYYTGIGGARIHARFARPKNLVKPTGAVIYFHGYRASFPEWYRMLVFAGQGLCVAAMDCRGQAGKSEDKGGVIGNTVTGHIIRGAFEEDPKKLLYRSIYLDTVQLANIVMNFDYVDSEKIYSFGGSQGGALALVCSALEPRIKKTVAYCPFLCDFKKAYEMNGVAFSEIQDYFIRTDPRHKTEEYLFNKLGYIDVKNFAHRIRAKVKMLTGMLDQSCPPITQFAMYNRINSEKEYYLYPDYGHADYPEVFDIALRWFIES